MLSHGFGLAELRRRAVGGVALQGVSEKRRCPDDMGRGAKVIRARRASDAPLRQKSLKLLELYRATPAEVQS